MKRKKTRKSKDATKQKRLLKNLLMQLEEEYRKANISDSSYRELRQVYSEKLKDLGGKHNFVPNPFHGLDLVRTDGGKQTKEKKEEPKEKRLEPGEIEEVTPEVIEKLAAQMAGDEGADMSEVGDEEEEEDTSKELADSKLKVELEKLKVMIDTVKDSKRITDETIQTVSETIGEMRSMLFQTDASLKEAMVKVEKLEDDVADVRPEEFSKRIREVNTTLDKIQGEMEKLNTKTTGQGERLNKVFEMVKTLGGVENLINLNKKIQLKLGDIKDAEKYIERVGNKIEKMYIDLNRGIEDLILIRAKQEDFEGSLKDIIKTIDSINVRFGGYVNKKDMDEYREEVEIIKKQLESLNRVIPIAELKIPESIIELRKEREGILMLLEAAEEQYKKGDITEEEFEKLKSGNMSKLSDIKSKLKDEWETFERTFKTEKPQKGGEEPAEVLEEPEEESTEEIQEEETGEPIEEETQEAPEESEPAEIEKPKKKKEKLKKHIEKKKISKVEKEAVMKQIDSGNLKSEEEIEKEIEFVKKAKKEMTKKPVKKKVPTKKAVKKKTVKRKSDKKKTTKKAKVKKKVVKKKKSKKKTSTQQKKMILSGLKRMR